MIYRHLFGPVQTVAAYISRVTVDLVVSPANDVNTAVDSDTVLIQLNSDYSADPNSTKVRQM